MIGDGFKCVSDDDPYDVELADDSEEATVDICDFGVVKFRPGYIFRSDRLRIPREIKFEVLETQFHAREGVVL